MKPVRLVLALFLGVFSALLSLRPSVASVAADPLPKRAYIDGVVGHAQTLPLSCESRSAVDWAAFWGVDIRERRFLNNLPRSDNPDLGYVGDPNDPWGRIPPSSYGIHAEPVAALLREYGLAAQARRDMKWDELRLEIASGRPVIVWVVGQVWRGKPVQYKASDGQTTTVARFEHTMILIGYEPSVVNLVDAYTGKVQTHPLSTFLASWGTLGNMAVVGQAEEQEEQEEPDPTGKAYLPAILGGSRLSLGAATPEPQQKTYTVQRGDYLAGIARKFQVNLRKLADLNNLNPPYVLYPGKVLKIP